MNGNVKMQILPGVIFATLFTFVGVCNSQVEKKAETQNPTGPRLFKIGPSVGDVDTYGRSRIDIVRLLDNDSVFQVHMPEMSIVRLSVEQQRKLSEAFRRKKSPIDLENERLSKELLNLVKEPTPENQEKVEKIQKKTLDLNLEEEQLAWEFGFTIADELSDRQLEALRGLAYMKALEHFGSFEKLLVQSHAESQMDWSKIYREDPELQKKLIGISAEYRRKLMELQKETMEQVLEALPEESRAVVEYAAGVDTLKRTTPK